MGTLIDADSRLCEALATTAPAVEAYTRRADAVRALPVLATCAVAAATAPAVEAQLAALREALGVVRGCYVALAGVDHGILAYVDEAIAKAPAPTVEAYTRRVQAEALESAATDLEAWGDPHAADAIAELRRRARELRGGR